MNRAVPMMMKGERMKQKQAVGKAEGMFDYYTKRGKGRKKNKWDHAKK
jgi:hypothetical protein